MQPGSADVSASGPSVCDLATSAQTSTNCQCESLEKPHVVQKWLHHTGCLESTPAGCRPQLEAHLGGGLMKRSMLLREFFLRGVVWR
jgi:hypothetical protein